MIRQAVRLVSAVAVLALAGAAPASCSAGAGEGEVAGSLKVPDCWTGPFDLAPDFFGGAPYREGFSFRIQNGGDYASFSDGLAVFVDDVTALRPNPETRDPGRLGQALEVGLPPGVTPPGRPIVPDPTPPPTSVAVYLQRTCRTRTPSLYAVEEVTLPLDGTCDAPSMPGADPTVGCDPARPAPSGPGTGKSLMAFTSLFAGRPDEPDARNRLTEGCFDIYLADPRELSVDGQGPPPPCRGHLRGTFRFFFERGRPEQPFP